MPPFTPPDWNAALKEPTVRTTDPATGFQFDTTSPVWKNACAPLPSCVALQWPGYATTCIPDTLDGEEVVIQPWMGHCEQFFGRASFPGGFGGEVGVYKRVPAGRPLPDLSGLPKSVQDLLKAVAQMGADHLWWPAPDLQPTIDFTIINPVTNDVLLRADPEDNYWVNKWMEPKSYAQYRAAHLGRMPLWPTHYKMVFTVNGRTRAWSGGAVTG